jgi:hypothetical protein
MFVLTSNCHKINEYQEFGIEARLGPDIDEVLGTIDEVITYKILSSEPYILVEDTVLEIGGQEIVDVKFKLKNITEHDNALWITSLGYHDNSYLYVYRGIIEGRIVSPVIEHETSFEPYFMPIDAGITLYELKQRGQKDKFSARRLALEAFRNDQPAFLRKISDVPKWKGKYQNRKDGTEAR